LVPEPLLLEESPLGDQLKQFTEEAGLLRPHVIVVGIPGQQILAVQRDGVLELLLNKGNLLLFELDLQGLFGLQGLGAGFYCNDLFAEELIV